MLDPVTPSSFERLAAVDCTPHIESKNGLSYLSWAWAVHYLLKEDPNATWSYQFWDGQPFCLIGDTAMVFCTVKAFGLERTAQLPVMNHRNQPIPNPNAFEVNTAMQRCLAKAIALHGLGLYIYAGEDLPEGEDKLPEAQFAAFMQQVAEAQDKDSLAAIWKEATKACKDANDAEAHQAIKAAITERSASLKAAA